MGLFMLNFSVYTERAIPIDVNGKTCMLRGDITTYISCSCFIGCLSLTLSLARGPLLLKFHCLCEQND